MLKIILSELKEYKHATIVTPLWVILEALMEVFIPYQLSIMVDQGIEKGDMHIVGISATLMLGAAILSLFCGFQSGKYAAYASSGFAKNLRKAEYENISNFSFKEIDDYSTGSLITRMTTDVTNVQMAFMMVIRTCARAPMMLIASLVMTFWINRKIALIFLIVSIFLAAVLFSVIFIVRPIFNRLFKKYDALNARIQENITGIRVVKSFVREPYEINKFKQTSEDLFKTQRKAERILSINSPAMQLSAYIMILGISWVGAHMIVSSQLTTGQFMTLLTYVMNILFSLMMLSMVVVMVSMSIASGQRISEVLTQKSSIVSPENAVTSVPDGSIQFDHVYFDYGKNDKEDEHVLSDINLSIPTGSTVGIFGATGSSKSSLVQLIPRLYDVTAGSIKVGGIDVRKYEVEVLRDNVAMVLQKNILFSGSIKDNMRWGNPKASDEEILEACQWAQADEFIQKMPDKYDSHIERGGANVSGGQRQRLCIARALLKKPKILILDDSTSAVDTKTDALIRQAFKEKVPHITRLIISQRISSIQDADTIIVLNNGKIDAVGNHETLLKTSPTYKETFEAQQEGGGDFDEAE
ncbi:MAG: ABC transporter ATP-binding protein [Absicoccus porci]|uniref:ABC transporter ATP-binding protein n=1 Tax=Absicoccus porci TaxID=2486576 RepID=A0A3N0HY58_9FIRM|nr:ABC transporter ATP-binding protein [Absicoccus porci]MCI6087401.1 ABC transporter ATP-binding protein/permease [Absicoccus porci]MDD7330782.1 ABC transporter ATP-binding protein [Absicoccus porci]MDY4738238.1 ABC transporter ATP-binding protein [Absicoccus porci]RNM29709.1 ABC transporter ATP-binding protein [Absicoccus porci]